MQSQWQSLSSIAQQLKFFFCSTITRRLTHTTSKTNIFQQRDKIKRRNRQITNAMSAVMLSFGPIVLDLRMFGTLLGEHANLANT